ncbi:IS630 family transposase, partial [Arthrobacter wenxiniae]
MAHPPAPAVVLRDGDGEVLAGRMRSSSVRAGLAQRSRIVLLAAEGLANVRIAELAGVSVPTVAAWRGRYLAFGLDGLEDRARVGRPRKIDRAKIITATLKPPPKKFGVTHWSARLLARYLRIDFSTVARTCREYGVKPWKDETFKFSTDPELEAKVLDVVGLYMAPPDKAVVLCIDELCEASH